MSLLVGPAGLEPSTRRYERRGSPVTLDFILFSGFDGCRSSPFVHGVSVVNEMAAAQDVSRGGADAFPLYTAAANRSWAAALNSLAVFSARRRNGSSVSLLKVMRRLQLPQLSWTPSRTRLALSPNRRVQAGQRILTLSSTTEPLLLKEAALHAARYEMVTVRRQSTSPDERVRDIGRKQVSVNLHKKKPCPMGIKGQGFRSVHRLGRSKKKLDRLTLPRTLIQSY